MGARVEGAGCVIVQKPFVKLLLSSVAGNGRTVGRVGGMERGGHVHFSASTSTSNATSERDAVSVHLNDEYFLPLLHQLLETRVIRR